MKIVILFGLLSTVLGKIEKYHGFFNYLDSDQNGYVERIDVSSFFSRFDENGDEKLTYGEFTPALSSDTPTKVGQGIFSYLDKLDNMEDRNIAVTVYNPLFDILDSNNDGQCNFVEYTANLRQVYDGFLTAIQELQG